jgi:murein L,D-transpeptidase YcbB/YkuD
VDRAGARLLSGRRAPRQCAARRAPSQAAATLIAALVAALVVAPPLAAQPADAVRVEIPTAISVQLAAARGASPEHGAAQALQAVYARGADAPLWLRDGHVSAQAASLLQELQRATSYGLEPEDYAAPELARSADALGHSAGGDAALAARFDVQLSAAALHFMSDLHYGRVDPAAAGFNLQAVHAPLDLAASLESLTRAGDVPAALVAVEPPFYHYHLLKFALARYLALAADPTLTELPPPPAGLRSGGEYAGAAALRRLLAALGDLPPGAGSADTSPAIFDATLAGALASFQQRHGLTADGVPGKATFAALTTPLAQRVRQIDLTLERWRWLPPFQSPPIIVNIPQFRLFAFRTTEDRVADILQMDVIVGRTFQGMQTPVFESDMRYLVFRPYWDVPASITRREFLPKVRANPAYLAAQRLEIVNGQTDSSPVVPPTPENIAALAAGQLRLRQQPGEDNALGLVKFMFPNSYNVYLHSTPAHQLFKETRRAFSHGCIRVSDPVALAELVLRGGPGEWDRDKIVAVMNGTTPQRVNLPRPINVLILYGTALATEAGPTLFFDDIYGYDGRLERQLHLAPAH